MKWQEYEYSWLGIIYGQALFIYHSQQLSGLSPLPASTAASLSPSSALTLSNVLHTLSCPGVAVSSQGLTVH